MNKGLIGASCVACVLSVCGVVASAQGTDQHAQRMSIVHGCWGDEHGHLSGGQFAVPSTLEAGEPVSLDGFVGRGVSGDNRIDLVIVGDGYTASEMGRYRLDAEDIAESFFRYEPFVRYEPYFRVTIVDVVSVESGVDNDPVQGVSRNTALDMAYWCGGTERLLCVNVGAARSWAFGGAPDVDQILAIANSSKYGGAGYSSSDLGTAAGQNSAAVEIAIHEMGHSLGDLADEYTYGGPTVFPGGEPNAENLSLRNSAQMAAQETKWHRWLGTNMSGFDGTVSTFEGGGYSPEGVYRPTNNSMMRSLARPFNLPSAEKLIREFYREVSPIDGGTANGASIGVGGLASVTPMRPNGVPLLIEWEVGGAAVAAADGMESVTAGDLGLPAGSHTVTVRVSDTTPWVRSPLTRDQVLTAERSFTMTGCAAYADLNGDRVLDLADVNAFVGAFVDGDAAADIAAPAGVLDLSDLTAFISAFGGGCR